MAYLLAAAAVLVTLASTPADAQRRGGGVWCAVYSDGGRNCSFRSLRQCRATVSGDNRGTCVRGR